jgi:hypothetical protein
VPTPELSHPQIGPDDGDELYPSQADDADELTADEARKVLGNISKATFWRQVGAGYLPAPTYVTPRAPRWTRGKLRRHKARNQRLPRDAKELRRQERLARERNHNLAPTDQVREVGGGRE